MMSKDRTTSDLRRVTVVVFAMLCISGALIWRAVDLHVYRKDFLQKQGDQRYMSDISEMGHRGTIMDRYGEPLAISTPVDTIGVDPRKLVKVPAQWPVLAKALSMDGEQLKQTLQRHKNHEFIYLKRHVTPQLVRDVMKLDVPGVDTRREYNRYYPAGEVASHLVGVTNIDDGGQEGIELAYDDWLKSTAGSKRVIKDLLGRTIKVVEQVKVPREGQDLVLSIDRRVQYLAYRELKAAVNEHRAESGSIVVLDTQTGEVLAMVNQPSYNPNNRSGILSAHLRNRAITDVLEPGSTVKPFTVAAAMEAGQYQPDTIVDTSPGLLRVGRKTIRDHHNYGRINVSTIIKKSSNVGASRLALSITPKALWEAYASVGFGAGSGSGFPGESTGLLSEHTNWKKLERATLSFGYGLSVTPLQLARAYSVFANNGILKPVTLVRLASHPNELLPEQERVMSKDTAIKVRGMLEQVVAKGGTGSKAQVHGYRVAGKTGTVKKFGAGGYVEKNYLAVFAGMAPASDPRLVMVVVINEPRGEEYYGGAVAAPVFAKVMSGALRLLDVPPDNLPTLNQGARIAMLEDK